MSFLSSWTLSFMLQYHEKQCTCRLPTIYSPSIEGNRLQRPLWSAHLCVYQNEDAEDPESQEYNFTVKYLETQGTGNTLQAINFLLGTSTNMKHHKPKQKQEFIFLQSWNQICAMDLQIITREIQDCCNYHYKLSLPLQDGGKSLQEGMEENSTLTQMDLRLTEVGQESEYCINQLLRGNVNQQYLKAKQL